MMNATMRIIFNKSIKGKTKQNLKKFMDKIKTNYSHSIENDYWKIEGCIELTINLKFAECSLSAVKVALEESFSIKQSEIVEYKDNNSVELSKYSLLSELCTSSDIFLVMYIPL